MKIFVPPIKIQGIKTKLTPWIIEQIKEPIYGKWIEPFMGSGVVGFNIRPKRALFADKNPHIISFYNAIKNGFINYQEVQAFLQSEGEKLAQKGEEYYYEVRYRFNKEHNPLDFLFLNRSCFNGVVRFNKNGFFNTPFGKKPKRFAKAYITKIVNQIKYVQLCIKQNDWEFVCDDFRSIIPKAEQKDLIYCDPPYIDRNTNYYDTWSESDEKDLYKLLKETKAYFLLSTWFENRYRKNEYIQKFWKEFNIVKKEHFYHVGAKESNRNSIIEALVLNFEPQDKIQSPQQLEFILI